MLRVLPPRRCLYEISETSRDKLVLLTTGISLQAIAKVIQGVSVQDAGCFSKVRPRFPFRVASWPSAMRRARQIIADG